MNKILLLLIVIFFLISGCTSVSIPLETNNNNSSTTTRTQSYGYNNLIVDTTLSTNYSEICFKNGSTLTDIHGANESTIGGNCTVGDRGFIIEKVERNPLKWEFAQEACLQENMRLPTEFEFKFACRERNTFELFFMVNNWEWVSNEVYPSDTKLETSIMGDGGCNFAQSGLVGTATGGEATYHFRCAR